jgi:hypothetical protein
MPKSNNSKSKKANKKMGSRLRKMYQILSLKGGYDQKIQKNPKLKVSLFCVRFRNFKNYLIVCFALAAKKTI